MIDILLKNKDGFHRAPTEALHERGQYGDGGASSMCLQ